MASVEEVRGVLAFSRVPRELSDELLDDAPDLWLRGESPDVIAGDVALCHPPLSTKEVRVWCAPALIAGALRVSVLAHDRPGLLAATTGALAQAGLSVIQAAAMTWPTRGWALQRALVADPRCRSTRPAERDLLCARLRAAVRDGPGADVRFDPSGPVQVAAAAEPNGRHLLRVLAPDRPGLLWAITAWLERSRCNVLVARATPAGLQADDTFLLDGEPDADELWAHLSDAARAVAQR
ncbi:MAG: ACT domain-containing protein [Acidimicrobiia bacterium]|nr:ACT domain-containing protein [Acidimicrobiia bacterium]